MSGGKQLSFPVFKATMYKGDNPDKTIMECALFLCSTDLVKTRNSWRVFACRFFEYYQPVILGYFGYEPDVLTISKVKVNDTGLFMAVMTAMLKTSRLDCQANELTVALDSVFELRLKRSSIQQGLCSQLLEYEEVLNFFKNFEKYDFKK